MLDILLVVLALAVIGACAGDRRLRIGSRGGLGDQVVGMVQQACGARSFRSGGPPGGVFDCRSVAMATVLARPAPWQRPASLDGWSGDGGGLR